MKQLIILLIAILIGGCAEKRIPNTDIFELKKIGMLSTSEYTVGKIIQLNDEPAWYKFGDRKILISCKAKIKAGVNLMEAELIEENGQMIVKLPPVEIISVEMDPNLIKTEMEDVNGFRMSFDQTEKNKIMKLGEKAIYEQISTSSIYSEAEINALKFVKNFLEESGYENVKIEFKKTDESK